MTSLHHASSFDLASLDRLHQAYAYHALDMDISLDMPVPNLPRAIFSSGPAGSKSKSADSREAGGPDETAETPLRVLVVEDEAVIAMDIEMFLSDLGAEVVGTVATAEEALSKAGTHRPDCVTMDIHIKGDRDGVSTAIEIYERFGIRSIFVSAFGDEDTRSRAALSNPFGWIQKPYDEGELARLLRHISKRR